MMRARSDLALAKVSLPEEAVYEDLCVHAQQAAEKAIKAVYREHNLAFRYTHDLQDLLDGLKDSGVKVPPQVEQAAQLTEYAWDGRYPGLAEPVTEEQYHRALALAEAVVSWAAGVLGG